MYNSFPQKIWHHLAQTKGCILRILRILLPLLHLATWPHLMTSLDDVTYGGEGGLERQADRQRPALEGGYSKRGLPAL